MSQVQSLVERIKKDKQVRNLWWNIKFFVYNLTYGTYYRYIIYVCCHKIRKNMQILNSEYTLRYILKHRSSICRFGDGELSMITNYLHQDDASSYNNKTFQKYDAQLGARLLEVLLSEYSNCMICLPYAFKKFSVYKGYERFFFERECAYEQDLLKYIYKHRKQMNFGDSCFTRFYYNRTDIPHLPSYIQQMKQIWDNQDIVFLEGEKSRLGVGNDLFANAKSIQRFLLPATNAFGKYDEILAAVKRMSKSKLYLIALGHTATVLAYDMARLGFWAIDIGHVDIEYEWMRMGAKEKTAVPDKYVNEVSNGKIQTELDDPIYLSQIIGKIE